MESIDKITSSDGQDRSLRSIVFKTRTTNPFPTVFSTIFLAIHELSFKEGLLLANAGGTRDALSGVHGRLNTRRDALGSEARRNNINIVKGLIRDHFVTGDVSKVAFGARRELDIENTLRRSQIETPTFELKQGILRLDVGRAQDTNVFQNVLETICAISNIGPSSIGSVFVGVADDEADANRIATLDGINPRQVGDRWVVGIEREAARLKLSPERYYQLWRDAIDKSKLSLPLKSDVLSNLDLCIYKGMHILIVTIPSQRGVSLLDGRVFTRDGDQTVEATPEKILAISSRFQI